MQQSRLSKPSPPGGTTAKSLPSFAGKSSPFNIHVSVMWLNQCHKPSPSHHHIYRWCVYHSQSWVVYDIVLPTLFPFLIVYTTHLWWMWEWFILVLTALPSGF
jgi:hypothetical protein